MATPPALATPARPQWLTVALWWLRRVLVDALLLNGAVVGAVALLALLLAAGAATGLLDASWGNTPWAVLLGILVLCTSLGVALRIVYALGTYSKPLVRAGATRGSVVAGHWAVALLGAFLGWLGTMLDLVLLAPSPVPGRGIPLETHLGAIGAGLGVMLTLLVAVAVVLRLGWGWGVGVLLLWWVVLPMLLALVDLPAAVHQVLGREVSVGVEVTQDGGSMEVTSPGAWWTWWAHTVLLGAVHWLLMRRMPVD